MSNTTLEHTLQYTTLHTYVYPVQLRLLSVTELWPFDCVFMLILYIYILVHAINHSDFSQDDVLGTRMSVLLFKFESDAHCLNKPAYNALLAELLLNTTHHLGMSYNPS